MSTDDKIEQKIDASRGGAVLFMDDFMELGSSGAVHVSLHRLVKRGVIRRVSRGIYVKPKYQSSLLGEILPSGEDVAFHIAKRDKARIIPTGSFAMYKLGLSTQIPLNLVYLTDGSPRKIKVGNRSITFKKTTPKNLALKGKISRLVVLALKDIGKGKVTEVELNRIMSVLKDEDYKNLKHDIALAPRWIAEIMAKAI